ncbi:MAG: M56 family metallopeptidase [Planctomycetota bacterium]|jgi:beta-lactamase regulating signal transducer with metallopeptidase domain
MLWWLVQNTIIAAFMACVVLSICRSTRIGPAGRHFLWLVVLLKLVTPPLVFWPWSLPDLSEWLDQPVAVADTGAGPPIHKPTEADRIERYFGDDAAGLETDGPTVLAEQRVAPLEPGHAMRDSAALPDESLASADSFAGRPLWWSRFRRLTCLAGWLWLAGFVVMAGVQLSRIARMCRRLNASVVAPAWIQREVADLAVKLAIRPPEPVIAPELDSPVVWSFGRPKLLWPARLLNPSSPSCWRGVIVHELAHVRRRDHWVSWLELIGACMWWWNPLFWYVRRQLRENAELACDAWVVGVLPRARREYAEALLAVCRFTSSTAEPIPALEAGAGARRAFERRMTMILRETVPFRVSRSGLMVVAILALLSLPSWHQVAADPSAAPEAAPKHNPAAAEAPDTPADVEIDPLAAGPGDVEVTLASEPDVAREEAKLQKLERQLQQLMAELRALKAEKKGPVSRRASRSRAVRPVGAPAKVEGIGEAAPEKDLEQIQGVWVQTTTEEGLLGEVLSSKPRLAKKEVKGDTETVTFYDSKGSVLRAHTAKIQLRRAGPLRVFTFYDITHLAGPKKGEKEEGPKSYVYKMVDDTFVEIWGVLEESDSRVHALRWKRDKSAE